MKNMIKELIKKLDEKVALRAQQFLKIASDIGLKDEMILDGVVYYALKSSAIDVEEIKNLNKSTTNTIEILNKLDSINFTQQNEEAENLRKMFFAITKDIRIIMIKIAFVIAELNFLEEKNDQELKSFANSILLLYAPLAARLGLSTYKTILEDTAFMLNNPEEHDRIQKQIDQKYHKREPIVNRLTQLVEQCLKDIGIEGRVYGRKKHIYSIYKKLQEHTWDSIYDLVAVRAIVKSVPDCYALLGRLHTKVEPLQKRFKDYIAIPKSNGYQSLHTTVIFEGVPVEIQIRTEDMHKYAEYGVAAHWLYKEKKNKQDDLDSRLAWLRQMMEDDSTSLDDLANSLSQDIYEGEIFVQTPKGKVIYLPRGATPIDFAYAIHSEVGNKCVGAKINNKIKPTTSSLHNGDVVEIITNPNSKGPSRDWLKIIKTSEAKNKINEVLNEEK